MAWAAVSALKKCRHIDGNADIGITISKEDSDRYRQGAAIGYFRGPNVAGSGWT